MSRPEQQFKKVLKNPQAQYAVYPTVKVERISTTEHSYFISTKPMFEGGRRNNVFLGHQIRQSVVFKYVSKKEIPGNEVIVMKALQDTPGIIKLIEYTENAMYYILIIEYIPNSVDLLHYHYFKKLEENEAKKIMFQLILIIQNIYEKGFIHGDIKDENLIIDIKQKMIKVIDFGSAVRLNEDHPQYNMFGTWEYVCPEFYYYGYYYQLPLTVWTIGMVAVNLFRFRAENFYLNDILKGENYIPDHISETGKQFITDCLTINENKRLSFKGLVSHPWFKGLKKEIQPISELGVDYKNVIT
ncbi:BA71V-R298L (j8L) [African swine fever virus]|uniref:Serine/threonine-protein kinase 1 n=1 Tax=African swine fever virus TaxID=10497 RepID=A0A0C5BCU2_ASF|nr:BA71V-R298L (j8L) [African swine fever virus]AJL34298.1 BA71V-R298L (j8L) [African swine fever virus]